MPAKATNDALIQELAKVFHTPEKIDRLLEMADLPRTKLPVYSSQAPIDYWRSVVREIDYGIVSSGRSKLLKAAAEEYPGNVIFSTQPSSHEPDLPRRKKEIWLAADLQHLLGELAGENEWTASIPSKDGFLVYGQYISLAPGRYAADYHLKIDDNSTQSLNDRVAIIDASSNTGNKMIIRRAVRRSDFSASDTYQIFELPFELKDGEDNVEMRVFYTNKAQLTVAMIELFELK